MKLLKTILISVYLLLVLLLLLTNLKSCGSGSPSSDGLSPEVGSEAGEETDSVSEETSSEDVRDAERIGSSGALKVTLLWDFEGDIDLHVLQPNGTEIFYDHKTDSSTGGALDVDNRDGGNGSAENIYWEEPPKGEYLVKLVYYKGSESTGVAGSGACRVVVFQEGKEPQTYTMEMSSVGEVKNIVKINIR